VLVNGQLITQSSGFVINVLKEETRQASAKSERVTGQMVTI